MNLPNYLENYKVFDIRFFLFYLILLIVFTILKHLISLSFNFPDFLIILIIIMLCRKFSWTELFSLGNSFAVANSLFLFILFKITNIDQIKENLIFFYYIPETIGIYFSLIIGALLFRK